MEGCYLPYFDLEFKPGCRNQCLTTPKQTGLDADITYFLGWDLASYSVQTYHIVNKVSLCQATTRGELQ